MLIAAIALASALNAEAARIVDSGKTVGVQYAVVSDGVIAASGAAGVADINAHAAVTADTRFRIGSVTKLFTAVAVMQLVEHHDLSLDDTLARFEPSFPSASSITVRDLLLHRSGIADYIDTALANGSAQKPTTPPEILLSMAVKPLLSAPGSAFAYSNTNYVLLGQIVERLSGLPLHEYFRSKIFEPAGMTQTFTGPPPSGIPLATGYVGRPDATFAPADPGDITWYYACGDGWSTAQDLARFDLALMNGVLLQSATLQSMIAAAQPSTFGHRVSYGLGLTRMSSGGSDPLVGHHGGLPGFEAEDEMIVPDRFAVISLGNASSYPTYLMNAVAFEALYPDRVRVLRAESLADAKAKAAEEDPALTKRFTAFFTSILSGKVDPAGLSSAMASAMTANQVQQIARYFAKDGKFVKLQYIDQDSVQGYRRYHYGAVFSGASQPVMFVLDSKNELSGFFLQ